MAPKLNAQSQQPRYGGFTPNQSSPSGRKPLQQRSDSESNWKTSAAIRLVPKTPPRLLGRDNSDDGYYYSRSPLPTRPSQFLSPRSDGSKSTLSPTEPLRRSTNLPSPSYTSSTTAQPSLKPSVKKRQLHIHQDNKTFSLKFPESNDNDSASETDRERDFRAKPSSSNISSSLKPCSKRSSCTEKSLHTQRSIGPKISDSSCTSSTELPNSLSITSSPDKSRKSPCVKSINSSPCNYEFVGGLRKVAKTPEHKSQEPSFPSGLSQDQLAVSDHSLYATHDLSSKPSFSSTESNCSETTNYKTYSGVGGSTSPRSLLLLSSPCISSYPSSQNSSPDSLSPTIYRSTKEPKPRGRDYRDPISSPVEELNPSQLSLVVSPLTRKSSKSRENFGFYNIKSTDPHRPGSSLTSLSSIFIHKDSLRGLISSGSILQIPYHSLRSTKSQSSSSSWVESLTLYPPRSHMNEHPHQWSSQLSTVLSVSEDGSDRSSLFSEDSQNSFGSRGRVMSVGSGYMSVEPATQISRSMSWSESTIDQPPMAFSHRPRNNSSSSFRVIGEQDEYGDRLTDLQIMRARPLRRRTSGYLSSTSSENGRSNTIKSTISTKSNSLNLALLPSWARIYYGNGERYFWCGSTVGGFDSRTNSLRNDSLGPDSALNIYNSRRRLRESDQPHGPSLNINSDPLPLQNGPDMQRASPKTLNSWSMASVRSPHLRRNSRIKRPCIWGPPSADFSSEGGLLEKRNLQVLMFIFGFLFPISWMIAAVLPISPLERDLMDENRSTPSPNLHPTELKYNAAAEARHESALWWRKLNRWMSVVGVLIICVIVALILIGIKQGWG
ncbi:hypothetical protein K3495_g5750 [Podosphaera aphanis]|nr:hypothetical protein K3495_g5750 [Podosphaera aphanis]